MNLSTDQLQHLHRLFYEELGIEQCGRPEDAVQVIYDVLASLPTWDGGSEKLDAIFGSDGGRQFVMSHLLRVGLVETGSLPGGWLGDRGKVFLRWLDGVDIEFGLFADPGPFGCGPEQVGSPHEDEPCTRDCWEGTWQVSPMGW